MDKDLAKALKKVDLDPADPLVNCAAQAALEIHSDAFECDPLASEDFETVATWIKSIVRHVPAYTRQ